MNYSLIFSLKPAVRLVETIFQTGLSKHYSIYLGKDNDGVEWIAENHKFTGVRLFRTDHFFANNKKVKVEHFKGSYYEREIAVKRALTLVGASYNLINYNCEHYASFVQTGMAESKQVENIRGLFTTAAAVVIIVGF